MKKYRIKSKARFTIFSIIAVLIIVTGVSTILGFNTVNSASMDQYKQIKVEAGDTIWNIAQEYTEPGEDVRNVVSDICDINEIKADQLKAGMNLIIPLND